MNYRDLLAYGYDFFCTVSTVGRYPISMSGYIPIVCAFVGKFHSFSHNFCWLWWHILAKVIAEILDHSDMSGEMIWQAVNKQFSQIIYTT